MTITPLVSTLTSTLPQLLLRATERWPNKSAWIFEPTGELYTFADVKNSVHSVTQELIKRGVKKGNHVAVMLPNVPAFPILWLALAQCGAVMIPLNPSYQFADGGYIITNSNAQFAITDQEHYTLLTKICTRSSPDIRVFMTNSLGVLESLGQNEESSATHNVSAHAEDVYPEDMLNIQYTSGTTGRPKGCTLSHYYWIRIASHLTAQFPNIQENDVMLTAQPFYYMDPQWNVVTALLSGATLIIEDRFHPSTFWEHVHKHRVTFFYCLGAMPHLLFKMPPRHDDRSHSVRAIFCSAIPARLHRELETRWGVPWYEIFGMTETGLDIMSPGDIDLKTIGQSVIGYPVSDREIRIVDDQDMPVAREISGELVIRGPGMLGSYYNNPEATNILFRGGWLHTGDIVKVSRGGLISYVTRKKEMIRRSGENIVAAEVEDVLKAHPSVSLAAVVGVADELRGEEVEVFIMLVDPTSRSTESLQELINYTSAHLANFKVPRFWVYVDDVPRTPSERVRKEQLKTQYANSPRYDRVTEVWSILQES